MVDVVWISVFSLFISFSLFNLLPSIPTPAIRSILPTLFPFSLLPRLVCTRMCIIGTCIDFRSNLFPFPVSTLAALSINYSRVQDRDIMNYSNDSRSQLLLSGTTISLSLEEEWRVCCGGLSFRARRSSFPSLLSHESVSTSMMPCSMIF